MRSNSEIIDIIILEKDRQNLSLSELARRVGLAKSAMSRYLNKTRQFPLNRAQDFANVLGISVEYLLGVENSSPSTSTVEKITLIADQLTPPRQAKALTYLEKQLLEQKNEEETKINEVSEVIQLYVYDYYDHAASAGTGQYLNDVRVEQIELPIDVDADFVIPIKGDSMEPDYHDGDLVFIQTSVDLNNGVIGVFNYNGEAYIKQLVIDTEQAYLHSLNPKYKDMPITPETDFRIIGEVVGRYKEE